MGGHILADNLTGGLLHFGQCLESVLVSGLPEELTFRLESEVVDDWTEAPGGVPLEHCWPFVARMLFL